MNGTAVRRRDLGSLEEFHDSELSKLSLAVAEMATTLEARETDRAGDALVRLVSSSPPSASFLRMLKHFLGRPGVCPCCTEKRELNPHQNTMKALMDDNSCPVCGEAFPNEEPHFDTEQQSLDSARLAALRSEYEESILARAKAESRLRERRSELELVLHELQEVRDELWKIEVENPISGKGQLARRLAAMEEARELLEQKTSAKEAALARFASIQEETAKLLTSIEDVPGRRVWR